MMIDKKMYGYVVLLAVFISTVQSAKIIPRPIKREIRTRRSGLLASNTLPEIKYAVMLDAGSTSTRVKVYRYIQTAGHGVSPSDISEMPIIGESKVKPGISSYYEDPIQAAKSLQPLLDAAKASVPQAFQSQTPIFLFATAGIRSLQLDPKTEKSAAKILEEISNSLSNKDVSPFVFQHDHVRVISGQEESVFSWITVNWLKGVLNTDKSTFGTLDLGGSSAEVGYEFNTEDTNIFKLKLQNSEKYVYAVAHEHFGTEQARKMHMIKLIELRKNKRINIAWSPCYNKGYSEKYSFNGKEYIIKGYGNGRYCYIFNQKLFTTKNTCEVDPCNMDSSSQPELKGPLYLFSGFYYSLKGIGVLVSDCEQTVTFKDINPKLSKYCKISSEELEKTGNEWAKYTCFMVSYAKALITKGFKISDDTELRVVGEMKGVKIGWGLGAVLYNLHLL